MASISQKSNSTTIDRKSPAEALASESGQTGLAEYIYKGIFELSLDALIIHDADGKILDLNQKAAELFKVPKSEALKRNILDFHSCEKTNRCREVLKAVQKNGSTRTEVAMRFGKSKEITIELLSTLIQIGKQSIVLTSLKDVSDRKKTELELDKSERRYKSIFESFLDFYYQTDMKGIITNVSPSCLELSGFAIDELIGTPVEAFYPDPKQRRSLLEQLLRNGSINDFEVTLQNKAGKHIPVSVNSRLMRDESGRPIGIEGTLRDITIRKQAEAILTEREALLKATIESTADGILVVNESGVTILTNSRFVEMWRIPEKLVATRDDNKLLAFVLDQLVDPNAFLSKVKQLYASTQVSFDTLQFKDGRIFERYSCPLIIDDKLGGRVWSFRDITVLKSAERQLRESERKYKSLFNTIYDGIMAADLEEHLLFVNRAACEILGYSLDELLGRSLKEFVVESDKQLIDLETEKRINNQSSRYELTVIRKDGQHREILLSATPYLDDDGKVTSTVGVFSDITELKKAERDKQELKEKLINAQRMESLGILAGGVAHDLNNILGPLVAYPQMIKIGLPPDSPITAKLSKIENSAQRAAEVVQDLLTLARRGRYELSPTNVNELIESYLNSADFGDLSVKHPNIKLNKFIDPALPMVFGSQTHLYKVIMNLVINAIDAMGESGDLTIRTEFARIEKLASGFMLIEPGEYDIITISDTGGGIGKSDIKRIFEPFYSKKQLGRRSGSGLGLSIVYGVIKDHNGYIDVVSKLNKGSSFKIYLPAVSVDIETAKKFRPPDVRGSESVLIVDDVIEQRELAETVLSSFGYKVTSAASGEEAVEYLRANNVDIVILDMIMEPGMDGLDTYKKIIEIHPGQKAIISTGYSETDRVREAEKLGVGKVVRKPYTMQILGQAIREVLAEKKPETSPVA